MAAKSENVKAPEAAAEVTDPLKKMVTIRLPKSRTEKDDFYVRINAKTWAIQRGVNVEVPLAVAEQIQHHERMMEEAMAYEEAAIRKGGSL